MVKMRIIMLTTSVTRLVAVLKNFIEFTDATKRCSCTQIWLSTFGFNDNVNDNISLFSVIKTLSKYIRQ